MKDVRTSIDDVGIFIPVRTGMSGVPVVPVFGSIRVMFVLNCVVGQWCIVSSSPVEIVCVV